MWIRANGQANTPCYGAPITEGHADSGPLVGVVWHALYHPDYHRRLWNHTRSADPKRNILKALAGLEIILYRRWGIAPRPENEIEIIRRGQYTRLYSVMSKFDAFNMWIRGFDPLQGLYIKWCSIS